MSRQAFVQAITYADEPSGNLKIANSAEVSVFNAGTETLAKLYEERTGGALVGNPFILGATALADFWADSGDYDIKVHDTKGPARFGDFLFGWQSSPVNPSIAEGDLSNSGDIEWTQELSGAWVPQFKAGSVNSREWKPSAGELPMTAESLVLTEAYQDVVGCKLEITPSVASKLRVWGIFDVTAVEAENEFLGSIKLDAEAEKTMLARYRASVIGSRSTVCQMWVLKLSAAAHVIQLRAKRGNAKATTVFKSGTNMVFDLMAE